MNISLINLTCLIQKLLEENKKNNQETDLSNISSSNNIFFNTDSGNPQNLKNKGIEVNKKNVNTPINMNKKNNMTSLRKNITNQILNNSPIKNNYSSFYSNIQMNTMSNLKGLSFSNKWNKEHDDKNNNSNHSVVVENKSSTKKKKKKVNNNRNIYNKSLNSFDFRKTSFYNLTSKRYDTTKYMGNKYGKIESSFNKAFSKKSKDVKNRSIPKKGMNSKDHSDNLIEDSKTKEDNKESIINKNNKIYKISENNTRNSNVLGSMRKSFQKLNININSSNNQITGKRNNSKNSNNKSLSHCSTKVNLRTNNKPNVNISNNKVNNTTVNNNIKDPRLEKLSSLEKSYYILSKSPVLRLKERLLFSRSTSNLRNIQTIPDILNQNEILLKEKIKELEGKISECDKRINTVFSPSKTAEINFNFILSKDEEEFKNFVWFAENEKEKSEYFCFLKLVYLLFNESYENIELKSLSEKLYMAITKKGFKTVKEYLYYIYFKKKENNKIVYNIDKINNLLEEAEVDEKFNIKFCRFALFTSFLIKEIIKYGNEIKNMVELKIKTKEFIDVINNKLELFKVSNSKKIK